MSLIERIMEYSETSNVSMNQLIFVLKDDLVKEIMSETDLSQAERNRSDLQYTDLHPLANDRVCQLMFQIYKKTGNYRDKQTLEYIRNKIKQDVNLRIEINDYIIQTRNSPYDLKSLNFLNACGRFPHERDYSQEVYEKSMRELCRPMIDQAESAVRLYNILTKYLSFDLDTALLSSKSWEYGNGVLKFFLLCIDEVDAAENIDSLDAICQMVYSREVGHIPDDEVFDEIWDDLHKRITNKYVELYFREYKRADAAKLVKMYDRLKVTGYDEKLERKIRNRFKRRCRFELNAMNLSQQARNMVSLIESMVFGDSRHVLYDSEILRDARLKNINLVNRETRPLLAGSADQMSEYVKSILDEYGDVGYRKNSIIVKKFYEGRIDFEESFEEIDAIIRGIPINFSYRRHLRDYAEARKGQIRAKAIKMARKPKHIIKALALCSVGGEEWQVCIKKLEIHYVRRINKVKTPEHIGKLIEQYDSHIHQIYGRPLRYLNPVYIAAAEKVAKLIMASRVVS